MGSLGSAKPGNPHVLHTGDMLTSLRVHINHTGDMLPSLRIHWLSSDCLAGRIEHKLGKEVHVLVQAAKTQKQAELSKATLDISSRISFKVFFWKKTKFDYV